MLISIQKHLHIVKNMKILKITMKLFGSAEDRKIANVVADWLKGKKYEGSGVVVDKENVGQNSEKSLGDLTGIQANPYPISCTIVGTTTFSFFPLSCAIFWVPCTKFWVSSSFSWKYGCSTS